MSRVDSCTDPVASADPAPSAPEATRVALPQWLGWVLCGVALLGFAAAEIAWLRSPSIVTDWNGWRQVDTQSIALDFAATGHSIFFPSVRWGGAGPGYVESELALYPYLLSWLLRWFGAQEVVGAVLSTGLVVGAGTVLFATMRRLYGIEAALGSVLTLLCSRAVIFTANSVQPEALSLFLATLALAALVRWRETPTRLGWLAAYAVAITLACLSKPTAGVVLASGVVVSLLDPRLRPRWRTTMAVHLAIVLVGIAYLLHARGLFQAYGNTFGLLSGGDRKTPLPEHLLHPGLFLAAARVDLTWGIGWVGFVALLVQLQRRRLPDLLLVGLLVGQAAWLVASLRYSMNSLFGSHYHLFGGVVAAWAVGTTLADGPTSRRLHRLLVLLLLAVGLGQGALAFGARRRAARNDPNGDPIFVIGERLRAVAAPGDRVIVRSRAGEYEPAWKTRNNYEDPSVFYVAGVRGWVLPIDAVDPDRIVRWRAEGARFFVDPVTADLPDPIARWLDKNATCVVTSPAGSVWQLRSSGSVSH